MDVLKLGTWRWEVSLDFLGGSSLTTRALKSGKGRQVKNQRGDYRGNVLREAEKARKWISPLQLPKGSSAQ